MRKLLVTLSVAALVPLVGCGGATGPSDAAAPNAPAAPSSYDPTPSGPSGPPPSERPPVPEPVTGEVGEPVELRRGIVLTVDSVEQVDQAGALKLLEDDDPTTVTQINDDEPGDYYVARLTAKNLTEGYLETPNIQLRTDQTVSYKHLGRAGPRGTPGADFRDYKLAPGASYSGFVMFHSVEGDPQEVGVYYPGKGGEATEMAAIIDLK